MRISTLFKPKHLYRKKETKDPVPSQERGDEFTLVGHSLAVGLAAVSVVKEGLHYGQLMVQALVDGKPAPLNDSIHRLDVMDHALATHRRTYQSDPAPPLGEASPLKELPKAKLARPLMLVPGWDMAHDRFLTLTEKLTQDGDNGGAAFYLQDGQVFQDRDCRFPLAEADVPKDAKVFVTVFNHLGESPETSSPQLAKNLRLLNRLTGSETPDVMAYSQGGLSTRNLLDQGELKVGKLMMLGTPNQGAGLADVSKFLYQAQDKGYAVDWLMHSKHVDPDDEKSMRFMATDSPRLKELNSRWDDQMSQTEGFTIVGSAVDKTLHWGWPLLKSGDTMVEKEHLAPPGVEAEFVEKGPWVNHRDLPYSAQVYEKMLKHFDWI